jgi:hypothetical protein
MLCRAVLVRDLLLLRLLLLLLLLLLGVVMMDFRRAGTNADTVSKVVVIARSIASVRGWCMAGWIEVSWDVDGHNEEMTTTVAGQIKSDCSDSI